jgi:hypothetical protein
MFERHDVPAAWSDRLDAASVERWAALRRDGDRAGHYNLAHDRDLKRLRAELDALQRAQVSGIAAFIRNLQRHVGGRPD